MTAPTPEVLAAAERELARITDDGRERYNGGSPCAMDLDRYMVSRFVANLAARSDDWDAITEEWKQSLPGRVIDPGSLESTLIRIAGERFIVIESDNSIAIQSGMFCDTDGDYISLPTTISTRGQLRDLLAALGIKGKDGES